MTWFLAAPAASAEPAQALAETLVVGRSDVSGDLFYGGVEALRGTAELGPTRLEGYGDVGFSSGFDEPLGGELYLVTVDGEAGAVRWTLGRQPILLPTWTRRLDGGSLTFEADRSLSLGASAGVASRSGAAGTLGGVPIARLEADWRRRDLARAGAGLWGELALDPVAHGDLEAGVTPELGKLAPELAGIVAVAIRSGATALERGRAEASLRPLSGVRATGWVEHRESVPGTALSSDIFATFAPTGSDAVGLGAGFSNRRRDRLWASGSLQRWSLAVEPEADDEPVSGLVGEVRWEPRCGPQRWCLSPSWQGVSGEGGLYHRAGASLDVPLPSVVDLSLRGAWVPWLEPHLDWRSSYVAGGSAVLDAGRMLAVEAGCDLWFEAPALDTRAWLAVQIRGEGAR